MYRWIALVIGHIVEGFDCAMDSFGTSVHLDQIEEEFIGKVTFWIELDGIHKSVDLVEVFGGGEVVDESGVEGFVGFVVFAFAEVVEERESEVWVFEVLEDSDGLGWGQPVFVVEENVWVIGVDGGEFF